MIFSIADDFFVKIHKKEKIDSFEYIIDQIEKIMKSSNNVLLVESNYVFINRNDLLANLKDEKVKKIIINLCSMFTQYYSLIEKVNYRIILNFTTNKKLSNKTYLKWSYINKNNINLSDKVTFLTEDARDGKFYKQLVEKTETVISGTNLKFHYNNGGGGSIDYSYKNCVDFNEDFVFVIVDSDKKHPKDDIGETGRKISLAYEKSVDNKCFHTHLTILEVHEKENLIMPSEYKKNINFKSKLFEKLISLENEDQDYLLYYDLKKGIKKTEFIGDLKEYYTNLINKYPDLYINKNKLALVNFGEIVKKEFDIKELNTSSDTYIYKIRTKLCNLIYSFGISIHHHIA